MYTSIISDSLWANVLWDYCQIFLTFLKKNENKNSNIHVHDISQWNILYMPMFVTSYHYLKLRKNVFVDIKIDRCKQHLKSYILNTPIVSYLNCTGTTHGLPLKYQPGYIIYTLQWRHNGYDGVSNHQPHHCLHNRLLRKHQSSSSLAFLRHLVTSSWLAWMRIIGIL